MIFINLKGAIDSEENRVMVELWGGTSEICSVETFRRVLDEHPDEQEVCINIDCDGGSVEEGFKIYDLLRMSGRLSLIHICRRTFDYRPRIRNIQLDDSMGHDHHV